MFKNTKKLIVIGGVAAGMSAAAKARRVDPELAITVYTDDEHISYAGCGLPYYIGGKMAAKENLLARSVEDFAKQNISVHTLSRVEKIDPADRSVSIHDLNEQESYQEHYDSLIIATGARSLVPPFEGIEERGIFTLRSLKDALEIKEFMELTKPRNIVVIGGGYIGLEMAENFVDLGCQVTIVEKAPHIIPNMDGDMAEILTAYLISRGVEVRIGESVQGFSGKGLIKSVITDKGEIPADLVLLSIGVLPNSELAAACGIKLGPRKAILVDGQMRTSMDGIWAAGDCASVTHLLTGEDVYIPLGTTANKQGKIAGENVAGGNVFLPGVLGTGIARVLEMEVARTGLSERECQGQGIPYETRMIKGRTAANYFENSKDIYLKLIAHKESNRLLGGQIVGYTGAASRINTLVPALTIGATLEQLVNMDLAYSPPFSPVWDPVLIALNQF